MNTISRFTSKWEMIASLTSIAIALSATGCASSRSRSGRKDVAPVGIEDSLTLNDNLRPDENARYAYLYEPVYFAYDSSQIDASERSKIEGVAEGLRPKLNAGIIVEGHCDERGSREYNMALGERRALAVRSYLMGLGIDGSRIHTKSMGEECPAAFGHDEQTWGLNRRAEFVLFE